MPTSGDRYLVVTYVGYEADTVAVLDNSPLRITLAELRSLDEVVVTERQTGSFIIRNFTGTSISNGFQAELGLAIYQRIGLKFAYNFLDVFRIADSEKQTLPFNARHRLTSAFSFEPLHKRFHLDVNVHWMGEQRLANTSANPPEFQQPAFSDPFTVVNAQFTKVWSRTEAYVGCENIFDFRQLRPIRSWQDPFSPYFDTANAWGPTRGRELYVGVRYKID